MIPEGEGDIDYDGHRTCEEDKENGILETPYQEVLAAAAQKAEGAERAKAKAAALAAATTKKRAKGA